MPTVVIQPDETASKDIFISNTDGDNNFNPTSVLHVQSVNQRKALLQFDLSSVPNNVTIVSATLSLFQTTAVAAATIAVHRSLVEWYEGNGNGGVPTIKGSTWNNRNHIGPVAWTGGAGGVAGTEYDTTASSSQSVGTGIQYFDWDVAADVTAILNGTNQNLGWWVVATAGTTSIKVFAGSNGSAAQRPKLTITYTLNNLESVTLQPDNFSGEDTEIENNAPTANYGSRNDFHVGQSTSSSLNWKSLIKFNLASLPANIVVDSAILRLYNSAEDSGAPDGNVAVHRGLTQWFEGDQNGVAPESGVDGSTWNLRNVNGSLSWPGGAGGAAGSSYASSATATTLITATAAFYDWDVTADVRDFYNGVATNLGWWLIRPGAAGTLNRKFFTSSEGSTASQRPQLIITFSYSAKATIAGTSTVSAVKRAIANARATIAGTSTVIADASDPEYASATVQGTSTVTARIHGVRYVVATIEGTSELTASAFLLATDKARVVGCNPVPMLYVTDGTVKTNGQLNILNFLSGGYGFNLLNWQPQIAQYKDGGRYSSGPLAQGRRLRYRNFDNTVEVFELEAESWDQDPLIGYLQELMSWQEAAADYWVSDFVVNPIYLVAKAAREFNPRYAIIHTISVPQLENPYVQPFFSHTRSVVRSLTVRIERGHWLSTPPGKFDCVQISSIRSWTVSGWETGS